MWRLSHRAFVLPDLAEVTNYLIWRQQDATRNSVSMAAHAAFSHKSLHGQDSSKMIDRLRLEAGQPWEDTPTHRDAYHYLWDSLNAMAPWSSNPVVWVVEFKRL